MRLTARMNSNFRRTRAKIQRRGFNLLISPAFHPVYDSDLQIYILPPSLPVTMPPSPSPEALQSHILRTLDASSSGSIPDTRQLEWNGARLQSGEEQGAVKSVLDSLASREVSSCTFSYPLRIHSRDMIFSPLDTGRICVRAVADPKPFPSR